MKQTIEDTISPVVKKFTEVTEINQKNAQELLDLINDIKANQEEGQVMDKDANDALDDMADTCTEKIGE